MARTKPFVHLHVHSEYSILDGLGRQKDYLRRVAELEQPAIAFTEHGTLRGIYHLHRNLERLEADSKPRGIIGCELYVCKDRHTRGLSEEQDAEVRANASGRSGIREALYEREVELGLRERFHLTVLAKNERGLRNLFRLTSAAWLEGYWKRPRVDFDLLDKYGDGLVVLTGCVGGVVPSAIVAGKPKRARRRLEWLIDRFGDDLFLEIMPIDLKDQRTVNKAMLEFHKRYKRPLVATTDCHYIAPEHARTHDLLLCIRTHKTLADPNRFQFSTRQLWLKDYFEMLRAFRKFHPYMDERDVRRSLENTLMVAERCEARLAIDKFKALVPTPGLPRKFDGDEFAYLSELCWKGWEERDMLEHIAAVAKQKGTTRKRMRKAYLERLKYELAAIRKQNVVRYFLVVWDMMVWAKSARIVCGPGRGSAGGCLVSYLLHITDVDPVEHDLLFERFLNPDRIDLPDIDLDFEDARRDEVVQYLRRKYGENKTAHIATVTTLGGKGVVRDLGRVLGISYSEVDEATKGIVETGAKVKDVREQQLEQCFADSAVCREFDKRHPEVLRHARVLEGHARGLGVHAAGVVVSPVALRNVIPMEIREKGGTEMVVTGLEMDGCQSLGLLKIDVLGLRNLTQIKHCLTAIEERHGKKLDLNTINVNDKKVLRNFTQGNFVGIFQFDTQSAYNMSRGVEFTAFDDVVALNALNRPGTSQSGLAAEWLKRKKDPEAIVPIHPVVDRVCADTLGVIVYQEHVIRLLVEFAGFKPGEADSMRKKIGKSHGAKELAKEHDKFVNGAKRKGNDPKFADKLMTQIEAFGRYGFNKSHATAYGLIAYREMWLKTYYPAEFMFALMQGETDAVALRRYVKECNRLEIKVVPPTVQLSEVGYSLGDNKIIASLADVKGVGGLSAEAIVKARGKKRFKSFTDLRERVDRRRVNKRVVMALLRAGALDKLIPNRKWFVEHVDEVWKLLGKADWQRKVRELLADSINEADYSKQERALQAAEVSPIGTGRSPLEPYRKLLHEVCAIPWIPLDADDIYERGDGFVYGQIVDLKYKRVGDFEAGRSDATDDEKRRKKWGSPFALVHIEDMTGAARRMKVDTDTFDMYKPILDKGIGTPVAAHVALASGPTWQSMRAHFVVNLEELRKAIRDRQKLTTLQRAVLGGAIHPAADYTKHDVVEVAKNTRKSARFIGMVTHMSVRLDRAMNEMLFTGLLGRDGGYVDVVCFASSWEHFKGKFRVGDVVEMALSKGRGRGGYLLDVNSKSTVAVLSAR